MSNIKKNKQLLIALVFLAVIMVLVTIYMGTTIFFNSGTSTTTQPVVRTKVKASNEDFEKVLVVNSPSATPTVSPTIIAASVDRSVTPTPTEIVLAFNTPAATVSSSLSPTSVSTASATVTRMQTLPKTGFINNSLILFAVASTLVFVAFLF